MMQCIRMPLLALAVCGASAITLRSQTGPGGVGTTDGTSSLALWLRADRGVNQSGGAAATTTGDLAIEWLDYSGNGRTLTASSSPTDRRPTIGAGTDGINNRTVLRFDGTNDLMRSAAISPALAQPITLFAVSRKSGTGSTALSIVDSRSAGSNTLTLGYWSTNQARINAGTNNVLVNLTQASAAIMRGLFDGVSSAIAANGGTAVTGNAGTRTADGFTVGASRNSDQFLLGDVAEVIAFTSSLNAAQSTLVENYLSARYAITIGGDYYSSTTYTEDVAGIAKVAGATHGEGHSNGLILRDEGFLADNGDVLIGGHDGTSHGTEETELPSGVLERWSRVWYVERTSATGSTGNATIGFDFSEARLGSPGTAGNYRLLYRSGTSGDFSHVTPVDGATVSGRQVLFELAETSIANGYYTLGSTSLTDSPLPVLLVSFTARALGDDVLLEWTTASEIDNAGYILLRAENHGDYQPVASWHLDSTLKGAGTTAQRSDYRHIDRPHEKGTISYRLQQVDIDGRVESIGEVVSVELREALEHVERVTALQSVSPNPSSTSIAIRFSVPNEGEAIISIVDARGSRWLRHAFAASAGENVATIDVASLPPGRYWCRVESGGRVVVGTVLRR